MDRQPNGADLIGALQFVCLINKTTIIYQFLTRSAVQHITYLQTLKHGNNKDSLQNISNYTIKFLTNIPNVSIGTAFKLKNYTHTHTHTYIYMLV
jgi:hypothetical protein